MSLLVILSILITLIMFHRLSFEGDQDDQGTQHSHLEPVDHLHPFEDVSE